MQNKSPVSVGYAPQFKRDIKHLIKKYRHIRDDVENLIQQLEQGATPGDQLQGTGFTVYKTRLRSSDLRKGKSGSYRVIYYIKTAEFLLLVTIYIKTEQVDISAKEIQQLIDEFENPSS